MSDTESSIREAAPQGSPVSPSKFGREPARLFNGHLSVEHLRTPLARRRDGFRLSLVVPVMNEEDAVEPFLHAVRRVGIEDASAVELIFVDDGSTDRTVERLVRLGERFADGVELKIVRFARNFGKEAALSAGLLYATGDAVIPMDVDLQDPPELIPKLVDRWQEGFDVVNGLRVDRQADTLGKRLTAGLFYKIFNALGQRSIPENVGDFRLLDRCALEAVNSLAERTRFMKGLFSWVGFETAEVPYARPEREHGQTKFNFWKLWNFALDGLVNFSSLPLRIWTYVGLTVALGAIGYIFTVVVKTLAFGIDVPGYASTITLVLFFGAMQLLTMGVLGEYVSRLLMETKQRPLYIVSQTLDLHATGSAETRSEEPEASRPDPQAGN